MAVELAITVDVVFAERYGRAVYAQEGQVCGQSSDQDLREAVVAIVHLQYRCEATKQIQEWQKHEELRQSP